MESINPIIKLSEFIQNRFGENIETRVVNKEGPDHCPVITVDIELPDGSLFRAEGPNKRIAKQRAAEKALESFKNPLNNI